MSYLDVPRLHFAGEFRSDPATINNKLGSCCGGGFPPAECNYDLATAIAGVGDQELWNPGGRNHFELRSCTVRRTLDLTGQVRTRPDQDVLVGGAVTIAGVARLVDLDPSWQTGSQIWGLELQVTDSRSVGGFTGTMATATLRDLWPLRAPAPPPLPPPGDPTRFGDSLALGGVYQSVLTNVRWNPQFGPPQSHALAALRSASPSRLSIKLVVYAYDGDPGAPRGSNARFTLGRVVGTIGPALAGEPDHVPNARVLLNGAAPGTNPFGKAPFKVDAARGSLVVDLGNAIPESSPAGPRRALGTLRAEIDMPVPQAAVPLGTLDYSQAHYLETAGIEELPVNAAQQGQLASRPLRVVASAVSGRLVLTERATGLEIDVTETVVRLNPNEGHLVEFLATRRGTPASGVDVGLALLRGTPPGALGVFDASGLVPLPVLLPGTVRTDATGRARVRLFAGDPAHPRPHIDGQLYVLGYFAGPVVATNLRGRIAVRVYDSVAAPANPRWANVSGVLTQYARLYPSMTLIIDLSNHAQVQATRGALATAMRRPETAANYMPVTRDLSRDRKAMLLRWLDTGAPA